MVQGHCLTHARPGNPSRMMPTSAYGGHERSFVADVLRGAPFVGSESTTSSAAKSDVAPTGFLVGFSVSINPPTHFRLTFVSPPYFFSLCSAYRGDRYASVLIMPARLRDAISGILAGGIPGFGTATFLFGTLRSSC